MIKPCYECYWSDNRKEGISCPNRCSDFCDWAIEKNRRDKQHNHKPGGEDVAEPVAIKVGATGTFIGVKFTAKESCGSSGGRWACITHNKTFQNQLMKDSHIGDSNKPCTLAWICFDHGIEKP